MSLLREFLIAPSSLRENGGVSAPLFGERWMCVAVYDAYFPIPFHDVCWESIIDLLLVGESATSDSMLTAPTTCCEGPTGRRRLARLRHDDFDT